MSLTRCRGRTRRRTCAAISLPDQGRMFEQDELTSLSLDSIVAAATQSNGPKRPSSCRPGLTRALRLAQLRREHACSVVVGSVAYARVATPVSGRISCYWRAG